MRSVGSTLVDIKINTKQISIGVIGLVLGCLVYILARPPVYGYYDFIYHIISPSHSSMFFLGTAKDYLPTFFHAFGFCFLTAGFLFHRTRYYIFVCLSWLFIGCLFEILQYHGVAIASIIPKTFEDAFFVGNMSNYFRYGVYDPHDLLSIIFGVIFAFTLLLLTKGKEEQYD